MKSYSSREILKMLHDDGWSICEIAGSHHQLEHPIKKGKVTVPDPRKDLPPGTVQTILKQAGLK